MLKNDGSKIDYVIIFVYYHTHQSFVT